MMTVVEHTSATINITYQYLQGREFKTTPVDLLWSYTLFATHAGALIVDLNGQACVMSRA